MHSRFKAKVRSVVRRNTILSQNKFTFRYIGQAIQGVNANERNSYTGRIFNWHTDPAGGGVGVRYIDFGNQPTAAAEQGELGFLEKIPVQDTSSATGNSDSLFSRNGYINRYNPATDTNKLLYFWPTRCSFHWKNNSRYGVKLQFFVFKALQDIPAKACRPDADITDYSPIEMWSRGLAIGSALTEKTGLSNIADSLVMPTPITNMSDARRTYNKHWKCLKKAQFQMQPGDEVTQYITQPAKTLDLYQLMESFNKWGTTSYGCYALKGDYVCVSLIEGSLVHWNDAPAMGEEFGAVQYAGLAEIDVTAGESVDLIVKKQFKGVIKPQTSIEFYHFEDRLTNTAAVQRQVLPSTN